MNRVCGDLDERAVVGPTGASPAQDERRRYLMSGSRPVDPIAARVSGAFLLGALLGALRDGRVIDVDVWNDCVALALEKGETNG